MKEGFYLSGLWIPLISAAEPHLSPVAGSRGRWEQAVCSCEGSVSLMFISSPSEQFGAVARRFIIQ